MKPGNVIITCPHCMREIALDEVLTHQIRDQLEKEFKEAMNRRESDLKAKEEAMVAKEREFQRSLAQKDKEFHDLQDKLSEEFDGRLKTALSRKEIEVQQRAREEVTTEIEDLRKEVEEKARQVKQMREMELTLRREKQALAEEKEGLELEVVRRLDGERKKVQEETLRRADEEHRLKDREKESVIESLMGQIEELKRKADQGSQQLQGEVLEVELEELLKGSFPHDTILPVPKGMRGADVIQRVCTPSGQLCGTIIWESKRTKAWSDGWVEKLKEDQREAKAEIAALVTAVLPKDVTGFAKIEGVWVADYRIAMGLASALRYAVLQVAATKTSMEGRSEKMEMLYEYLAGAEFRQQIEGIVEGFVAMQRELDSEKRAMEKIWARREKRIEKVIKNTGRMYGSLQGIIGSSLPELKTLELKALAEGEE